MPNPCPKCNYFPMRCRCDELKLEAENARLREALEKAQNGVALGNELVAEMRATIRRLKEKANKFMTAWDEQNVEIAVQDGQVKRLREALERLQTWAKAYPLNVFPEPDFKKVAVVLKAAGLSLDAVSASNMRHVISRAKDITDQALKEK